MDEIGHLAYKADDTPYPGLCHCARDQAHYADGDAPVTGAWAVPREQIRLLGRRITDYYSRQPGQVPPDHPDADKPVGWGEHPRDCDCGDCP